eukprot:2142705-Amphidinium_carterae.1
MTDGKIHAMFLGASIAGQYTNPTTNSFYHHHKAITIETLAKSSNNKLNGSNQLNVQNKEGDDIKMTTVDNS